MRSAGWAPCTCLKRCFRRSRSSDCGKGATTKVGTRPCGRIGLSMRLVDSHVRGSVTLGRSVWEEPTMLTRMTDEDWATVLEVFRACRSRRGAKGRDDRKFLEALHYFSVHNITWRALPEAFGNWNSVWKRFWRLGQAGVFEAFFDALAATSRTAHLAGGMESGHGHHGQACPVKVSLQRLGCLCATAP